MKCPKCGFLEDKVIDSRSIREAEAIRRRRECLACAYRFTTYEYVEISQIVLKSDGKREPFDRSKLKKGIVLALTKRPFSNDSIEKIVSEIENSIGENYKGEVSSAEVGEAVMKKLREIDEVAYIRFASVYKRFRDVDEFRKALDRVETQIKG